MKPFHIGMAILVTTIWGGAFVVSKIGLETFSPTQLTALRFVVASLAAIWVPRPKISWPQLIAIGLTLFAGQFLLQFFGIANGMPSGLTAVVSQTQALFTVVLAAAVLGDLPTRRQYVGMAVALVGLVIIGLNLNASITTLGFALTLASALSWAIGNVLIKRLRDVNILSLIAWASLIPPLPALVLSMFLDGPAALLKTSSPIGWQTALAPLYLGLIASVFAYAIWGSLLRKYPVGAVVPFALLSPCVGMLASNIILNEKLSTFQLVGMMCIICGVGIVSIPFHLLTSRRWATKNQTTEQDKNN